MKFTTAAIAASAAALVSASPCGKAPSDTEIKTGDVFSIITIRSGSDIQYGSLQAANGAFYVNTPKQNATCSEDSNFASFRLTDAGELFLNTENTPQQAFVDRSGMGQGVFQYTTGTAGASANSERTGFALDENNNLVFKAQTDIGFQACPNAAQGGYSVWLDDTQNPGGNSNCLGFIARTLKSPKPVTCTYTSN
ncbi:uncharacterized protein M421DRAFT_420221 [Didymella exigua CBS 183.55]|uniref:Cell wall protein PhiA n=1 Tax=Didymella exigua CBS 183.55 TaxID=1150837 RepID=A0A6A5RNV2_9PLEO|nr:uncharacterized protein M421DRAFT_420221 [Didymella exigua CBS 183.55]KAF1928990.1 hypothetical protein M421DRAFT_420221 [Didymella exigua CBS 183.55]